MSDPDNFNPRYRARHGRFGHHNDRDLTVSQLEQSLRHFQRNAEFLDLISPVGTAAAGAAAVGEARRAHARSSASRLDKAARAITQLLGAVGKGVGRVVVAAPVVGFQYGTHQRIKSLYDEIGRRAKRDGVTDYREVSRTFAGLKRVEDRRQPTYDARPPAQPKTPPPVTRYNAQIPGVTAPLETERNPRRFLAEPPGGFGPEDRRSGSAPRPRRPGQQELRPQSEGWRPGKKLWDDSDAELRLDSTEKIAEAINDPRYRQDKGYREQVAQALAKSPQARVRPLFG